MKHEANKDQNLVNFLKQNQPFPSCSNQHQEEQLIAMICSGNIRSSWAKNRSLLLFSILTVLGLLLILARLEKNNVLPQIANEKDNIETFMIDAWEGSMAKQMESSQVQYLEEDWLFKTENNYLSSDP